MFISLAQSFKKKSFFLQQKDPQRLEELPSHTLYRESETLEHSVFKAISLSNLFPHGSWNQEGKVRKNVKASGN